MKKTLRIISILIAAVSLCTLFGCKNNEGDSIKVDKNISVTLLNGEHYEVVGDNKKVVAGGEDVTFAVVLQHGYRISGAYGDDCTYSEDLGFEQTVTFCNVRYKSTARLETEEMEKTPFSVNYGDETQGTVVVDSLLGTVSDGVFLQDDIVNISAQPEEGYRFWCWSRNDYMKEGGVFVDYSNELTDVDIVNNDNIYANFKSVTSIDNLIVYRFGNGIDVEQDCTNLLQHHYRANTLTAVDIRDNDIDCDSKMLVGWETVDGGYIGLGSRISLNEDELTILLPVFKDYTPESDFVIDGNGSVGYIGNSAAEEIIIPRKIDNQEVKTIQSNAFSGCKAKKYYLPDTVTDIEDGAFLGCEDLTEVYMSDSVKTVSDKSFEGCVNFTTLHMNAYLKPRYSDEEPSVATNVYDRLAFNADNEEQKLVILGGSSVKYGYCCYVADDLFAEYGKEIDVYNLGYNATYSEYAQFEIINAYLKAGDIFLHAPEQFTTAWYGNVSLSPLTNENGVKLTSGYYIFRLTEGNWQFLENLTINKYSNFFDMYQTFNNERLEMPAKEYDAVFPRLVGEREVGFRVTNEAAYNEWGQEERIHGHFLNWQLSSTINLAKQEIYNRLADKSVKVFVTFPPIKLDLLYYDFGEDGYIKGTEEYTEQVKQILSDSSVTVLLSQKDTVYNGIHFVEHDLHLGEPKRNDHTKNVISALLKELYPEVA